MSSTTRTLTSGLAGFIRKLGQKSVPPKENLENYSVSIGYLQTSANVRNFEKFAKSRSKTEKKTQQKDGVTWRVVKTKKRLIVNKMAN